MKLSIQQPEFFPWAGFFDKIIWADKTVILDNTQFKKRYFENRSQIKLNGQATWITVPVFTKGRFNQTIAEVTINNERDWGTKIWNSLVHAYRKAPFWKEQSEFLEDTFVTQKWDRLLDLNLHVITHICEQLCIPFEHCLSSEMGTSRSGSDLILEICIKAGATEYLSGQFGKTYLDEAAFDACGITLSYQKFTPNEYSPFDGDYIGPLGLIDSLVNLGNETMAHIERQP